MTDIEFGKKVVMEAKRLQSEGRDANQTAKILCDADPDACNYGIGIILNEQGKAFRTSPLLIETMQEELNNSTNGTYMNSMKIMDKVKESVLKWQRIPDKFWDRFVFCMPSDAGTGCVRTGLEYATIAQSAIAGIGVEELGWPAYKAIAKSLRLNIEEFPTASVTDKGGFLPLYQAGPMNTTGAVMPPEVIEQRAAAASKSSQVVLLDRAYSGFEYAGELASEGYDAIMQKSYTRNIKPFISANTHFILAVSPTKAFGSFALRPGGFLLVHVPDPDQRTEAQLLLNTLIRARGSSFEHPATRALARAMVNAADTLESEHSQILQRMAAAEEIWNKFGTGTPIEQLFNENYAGLFRNPKADDNAAEGLYGTHLYPVLSAGRCRINITGIPSDEALAKLHVETFARFIM